MDSIALEEQLDIIRRLAERGLNAAHNDPQNYWATDVFQAILDEVATTKTYLD
jgi:hypothetical protein